MTSPTSRRPSAPSEDPTGQAGELHQQATGAQPMLSSNQGLVVADDQNSLRPGARGPTLLEDFLLREKITHFDHERIPERIVHARGSAAHGYFECTRDCSEWTRAAFLGRIGERTEVFARFSTVAGGSGSVDTPRDVRGFAVKFYTQEGNFDLVGNNIPVFFIQDAIKFPDLIHAVKMEPDRGFPQAASAHDTFWDFISLMPESLHMVMWAMSDRAIPRSLRTIDGFGVHTFRLVDAAGMSRFVKFHWRSAQGVSSTTWDEAVKIAGADPDYHRRDLWESIDKGHFPAWELGFQIFDEALADSLPYDVLDPTKLIQEEIVPVVVVGRMVLNRNPANFFAETEQVAFCPSHVVPGIDFSNDPLLQGRLFSYLDTQLSRLGGPNFHQIPINRPRCPFHNLQRDAQMQMAVPSGRVAYEPNTLDPEGPRESAAHGFTSVPAQESGEKLRQRSERFADHYSQARLFFRSQSAPEQGHVIAAIAFELGKVSVEAIRSRVLGHLSVIDERLAASVAERLGIAPADIEPAHPARPVLDLPLSPRLSQNTRVGDELQDRQVAVLLADGFPDELFDELRSGLEKAGARVTLVAAMVGGAQSENGVTIKADQALAGAPSCLFDHVAALGSPQGFEALLKKPAATDWMRDAWRHLKVIAVDLPAHVLLDAAGIPGDDGVVTLQNKGAVRNYLRTAAGGKRFIREGMPGTDG
jgi:catalase